jgi:hypothetical protein
VIVGELEFVVFLDPRELGIGQPRPDVAPADPGQPAGGFLAQALSIAAVHGRTVAAAPEFAACPNGPQRPPRLSMVRRRSDDA